MNRFTVVTLAPMRSGSCWLHKVSEYIAKLKHDDVLMHKSHIADNIVKKHILNGAIVVSSQRDDVDAVIQSMVKAPRFRDFKPHARIVNEYRGNVQKCIDSCKTVEPDLLLSYEEITNDPIGCVEKLLYLFGVEADAYEIAYKFRKDDCEHWYQRGHIASEGTDRKFWSAS